MSTTHSSSGAKTYFTTANAFEVKFGYHRAVRKGPFIFVSGTTAFNPETGKIDHHDNAKQQALAAMHRCVEAVQRLGATKGDVVRVKMFVARQHDTAAVGEAYRECFGGVGQDDKEVGCAATMIVMKDGFVDPNMLVEVEVDAVV